MLTHVCASLPVVQKVCEQQGGSGRKQGHHLIQNCVLILNLIVVSLPLLFQLLLLPLPLLPLLLPGLPLCPLCISAATPGGTGHCPRGSRRRAGRTAGGGLASLLLLLLLLLLAPLLLLCPLLLQLLLEQLQGLLHIGGQLLTCKQPPHKPYQLRQTESLKGCTVPGVRCW
jgi:hypothetical protein